MTTETFEYLHARLKNEHTEATRKIEWLQSRTPSFIPYWKATQAKLEQLLAVAEALHNNTSLSEEQRYNNLYATYHHLMS